MESILADLPGWARALFYVVLSVGGAVMFIISRNKPAAPPASALQSIGMELGNKEQMERLIKAVDAVAHAINDKKQSEMDDKLDELLEKIEHLPDNRRR
ncbi:hypothetical protein [Tianweitania sediminis]|uniref:Uncharacterized protein n=1 Tax=Tianweitania sediminis TaxID=1502156 RepID=A0A8J7RH83_9HYPH|nr:hypothetical protein [Tianweitania sediminis]MBP0438401.1 hypothetical protein [Tianweitania sediminis]